MSWTGLSAIKHRLKAVVATALNDSTPVAVDFWVSIPDEEVDATTEAFLGMAESIEGGLIEIAMCLLDHQGLPASRVEALHSKFAHNASVRLAIACHQNTSGELLMSLARDSDAEVRRHATMRLLEKS